MRFPPAATANGPASSSRAPLVGDVRCRATGTAAGRFEPTRSGAEGFGLSRGRSRSRTGETVSLWARSGLGARILPVRDSPRPVALKLAVGDSAPLFGSGVGLALLAALPDPEVLALLRQHNAAADEPARQDPATLMAEIKRVRADGFVAAYGRWLPEAGAVAAAIAEPPGSEPLAIAVGGPAVRIQPREALIVAALREALGEVRLAA